jgi:hypothetical protein
MTNHSPFCMRAGARRLGVALLLLTFGHLAIAAVDRGAGPKEWSGDLAPITAGDWSYERAAHLLERAGFGGTPEEIKKLAAMTPEDALKFLVQYEGVENKNVRAFDESGVFDPGVDPFPPSRPATTELAKKKGEALGVKVKPDGNRRMQPVVNKFFYWLRASMLETNRIGYWWANRMVATRRPLEEKMALFWHGHFATNEEKVRDYRKMLKQLEMYQAKATGNFRDLVVGTAKDPAMLMYLDAGLNVKDAPNENFAREIMELFTMGVGNYTEKDIREAARAFTGWNVKGLDFVVNADKYDDIILKQKVTAEFIAGKLYKFFVRQELTPELRTKLGNLLRENNYELKPLLTTMFLSRDFYSEPSYATRIKSPVELVVSTYRKFGLDYAPGVPDFNIVTGALGQHLMRPPTVAGWAYGKAWITPGLLIERGNFARDMLFPDISFVPPDRTPMGGLGDTTKGVGEKIARGLDITAATKPEGKEDNGEMMAMSTMMADRDEDFNTRYASYRGWQMATERVKPIPRDPARLDLTAMVMAQQPRDAGQIVDYLLARFVRAPIASSDRDRLVEFLKTEMGTDDVQEAKSYMEEPLRLLMHLILSLPEYQLG